MTILPSEVKAALREQVFLIIRQDSPSTDKNVYGRVDAILAALQPEIERLVDEEKHEAWISVNQGATCCPDKHPTFYGAVTSSPQWKAWREKQYHHMTRDIDECEGIGVMSDGHFQEFLEFCLTHPKHEEQNHE